MTCKNKKTFRFFLAVFFSISSIIVFAQERFDTLASRLSYLSEAIPGLNQRAEVSVSGSSLTELIRGLASTHKINVDVSPALTQRVNTSFTNEPVRNVLLFLAKQYNLDLSFSGSIISIFPYVDPLLSMPPKPKELNITYTPKEETITLDLNQDSLSGVAKKITQLSNINIVLLPGLADKKISGYLQQMNVGHALEELAIINSFKVKKTNDSLFILEPLKPDEELIVKPTQSSNNAYVIQKTNSQLPSVEINTGNSNQRLVSLNVNNIPLKDVIKNVAEQAGVSYFIYSSIEGNTTANVSNMEFEKFLSFILQGSRYTYSNNAGVFMIGERKDEGLRSYKLIQFKNRSVDSLFAILPAELKKDVEVKEFKELNSFLLSGSLPQIQEIEAFAKQIDRQVPMITIEVILLDVKKGKAVRTGLKLGVADSVKTGGSLFGGLDYTFGARDINDFINRVGLNSVFNIGRVSPRFYASISALEDNSNIELRQTPKLSTLNGHPANLSIGNTRYYAVTTQNVIGSLNPQTVVTQQFYPVEANLSIDILPIVSGNDEVTLNIGVNISDFVGNANINQPPPASSSKFKSIIRVKNEEMIVLGGIERNEKSEEGSGVPLLSRIPILKWFFSSRTRSTSKVVSVVFIKPTIIY